MANHQGKISIGSSNPGIQSLLNTINVTAGNLQPGAIGSNSNWNNNPFSFEDEKLPQELVRKYEIYESTEDLLALSCAWHRLRNASRDSNNTHVGFTVTRLMDRNLFKAVTEDDRIFAANIRDYYSKKIMMVKLKNERMSEYREDLNTFIHSDGKKFVEKMFGLVYRLPQFYLYDTKLDSIFSGKNRKVQKTIPNLSTKTLNYVGSTMVDRRALKRNEYWFTDEDDALVAVYLDTKNPLLGVWEKLIQNPISLTGAYYTKRRDDSDFYVLEKFN